MSCQHWPNSWLTLHVGGLSRHSRFSNPSPAVTLWYIGCHPSFYSLFNCVLFCISNVAQWVQLKGWVSHTSHESRGREWRLPKCPHNYHKHVRARVRTLTFMRTFGQANHLLINTMSRSFNDARCHIGVTGLGARACYHTEMVKYRTTPNRT